MDWIEMNQVGPLMEYFQYDNKLSFPKKIVKYFLMTRATKIASNKTVLRVHLHILFSILQFLYCISEIRELGKG
jgi:hypothetical protein